MSTVREDLGFVHSPKPKVIPPRARVVSVQETGDAVYGPWSAVVLKPNGKTIEVFGKSEGAAEDNAVELMRRMNG